MKKAFVIIESYFNGEDTSDRVFKIVSDEEVARRICLEMNAARLSSYSTEYDYEEHEVD